MSGPQSTLLLLLSCCVGSVAAQTYPQQPLRLAIPFTAGGAADMVGRLVALAKAKPSALIYGSAGPGSPTHLGMELFRLSGVKMTPVPDKGAAPGTAPPMEFDRFIRAEIEKWSRVVKEVGLKID